MVLADPADLSLVFTRMNTGKAGPDEYNVSYSRGNNVNKSINYGVEGALPLTGKLPYI